MSKKKILWFVPGATTAEQKAQAQANGLSIRNPLAYSEGVGLEECDGVTGMAPKDYVEAFGQVDEPEGLSWQDVDNGGDGKMPIAKLREILTEKGIAFEAKAKKSELQALLDQAEVTTQIATLKAQLTEKAIAFEDTATLEELQALNTPAV